jgi:hypothetical protein
MFGDRINMLDNLRDELSPKVIETLKHIFGDDYATLTHHGQLIIDLSTVPRPDATAADSAALGIRLSEDTKDISIAVGGQPYTQFANEQETFKDTVQFRLTSVLTNMSNAQAEITAQIGPGLEHPDEPITVLNTPLPVGGFVYSGNVGDVGIARYDGQNFIITQMTPVETGSCDIASFTDNFTPTAQTGWFLGANSQTTFDGTTLILLEAGAPGGDIGTGFGPPNGNPPLFPPDGSRYSYYRCVTLPATTIRVEADVMQKPLCWLAGPYIRSAASASLVANYWQNRFEYWLNGVGNIVPGFQPSNNNLALELDVATGNVQFFINGNPAGSGNQAVDPGAEAVNYGVWCSAQDTQADAGRFNEVRMILTP